MTKKRVTIGITLAMTLTLIGALSACSPSAESSNTSPGDSAAITEYSTDSLLAAHEARGSDITNLTEVSIEGCTSSGCHGGDWDTLVEENEGMWTGIGQITDANPHESHGSSAYQCSDCHSLAETSVNQCNGCHVFETPEGWVDKEKTSATYGATNDEPVF